MEEDFGFGERGVVAVAPTSSGWDFKTHDRWSGLRKQVVLKMNRHQIPLCPEKVRTVQTAQGLTMDACRMYLEQPGNMKARADIAPGESSAREDDYWIHLYVMLSRVRNARNILAYGVPRKEYFSRGPPTWMKEGIAELEALAASSRQAVSEAGAQVFSREWSFPVAEEVLQRDAENRLVAEDRRKQRASVGSEVEETPEEAAEREARLRRSLREREHAEAEALRRVSEAAARSRQDGAGQAEGGGVGKKRRQASEQEEQREDVADAEEEQRRAERGAAGSAARRGQLGAVGRIGG